MDLSVIFESVGLLFMIIMAGLIASKKKIITESMNKEPSEGLSALLRDSCEVGHHPCDYAGLALLADDMSKPAHTVIIMSAMPASAMTSIFAEQFDKEKEFAAIVVSLTTLLSLASSAVLLNIILQKRM